MAMRERILSADILSINIGIPIDRQKNQDLKRVGEAMRTLGWKGPKLLRVGDKRGRGYWRHPSTGGIGMRFVTRDGKTPVTRRVPGSSLMIFISMIIPVTAVTTLKRLEIKP